MTERAPIVGPPDPITYLDEAAATAAGAAYKRRFLRALDLSPRQTVLDIGCGPGTDLAPMSAAIAAGGVVIGVDRDLRMVAEARRRLAGRSNVEVLAGEAERLPLADAVADRVRTDRVLQHVADPGRVLAEVRRVLRPGGTVGMAEPDWDTLVVADEDTETSRRVARFIAGRVRNATVGRELPHLCTCAGLRIRSAERWLVRFGEFGVADQVLGLRRNSARAVAAGAVGEAEVRSWLERRAAGPFIAGFTLHLVVAER